ncbi:MAG: putative metal-dependent hydrolase YjjV [Verrucomicrobiae bacterium]|nr:putative metal-dependent hydrolase YjjV [Verrucomicrobiae bacterium]
MNSEVTGLVDFHCHLDLYPDFEALIQECEEQQVFTLGVTTTPDAWPRNHALTKGTRHVRSALGIHPQLVASRPSEVEAWDRYLPEARYIGEVGLDSGPEHFNTLGAQKDVFAHVLERCARAGAKVLTVHSVRSATAVLDMLEEYAVTNNNRVVFHWFTGSAREAARAAELGCYFSVNEWMFKKESRRAVVAKLPVDRIITETDGPFTKTGDRPARPRDVSSAVDELCQLIRVGRSEMATTIRRNLRTLLTE